MTETKTNYTTESQHTITSIKSKLNLNKTAIGVKSTNH